VEKRVASLRHQFQLDLRELTSVREVEQFKVKYLGKKGVVAELMMQLRDCAAEERPRLGKCINDLKEEIQLQSEQVLHGFTLAEESARLIEEKIDVTLPGRRSFLGRMHPLTAFMQEMLDIFKEMGFSVQYGPDIDSDYNNFEGLNFPQDHPARDMQDTYYLSSDMLLRTHTSNTQLRVMQSADLPIRMVAPGTVYRNEDITARSHVFFHQVEGLYIDRNVSFADLFATMNTFLKRVFGSSVQTRFRSSFFPFTEPGVEVDVRCSSCKGSGCRLCKQSGWLEVVGAGMVHPHVLINGGIDPELYSGFAWGFGIERLAMLLYGVSDIRSFTENDQRFLAAF